VFNPDHKRGGIAVAHVGFVEPGTGYCDDAGAGLQTGSYGWKFCKRAEVMINEFPAIRQGSGPRRRPACGLEQPDSCGVEVEPPGREKPNVAPLLDCCPNGATGFEDDRLEAAFDQVSCGCQSNGTCTDDCDRKVSIHGCSYLQKWNSEVGGLFDERRGNAVSVVQGCEIALSIKCGGATGSRRSDGLAVAMVYGVATGKDARQVSAGGG
jgi:hypothetical protein